MRTMVGWDFIIEQTRKQLKLKYKFKSVFFKQNIHVQAKQYNKMTILKVIRNILNLTSYANFILKFRGKFSPKHLYVYSCSPHISFFLNKIRKYGTIFIQPMNYCFFFK